ncbi:hypothetical protein Hdeb2414_s0009g00322591 [Helianthus debilis subsp. tardiflorus]
MLQLYSCPKRTTTYFCNEFIARLKRGRLFDSNNKIPRKLEQVIKMVKSRL